MGVSMQVKSTSAFRGRINGRLIRLEPGDIVPPELRERALAGGWGEKVKADAPGKEGKKQASTPRQSGEVDGE